MKKRKKRGSVPLKGIRNICLLSYLLYPAPGQNQSVTNGVITGTVIDAVTREPSIGVSVNF